MYFTGLNLKNIFSLPAALVFESYSGSEVRIKRGSSYLAIDSNGIIQTRVSAPPIIKTVFITCSIYEMI